jgi:Putative prokaryotic signal transducing protein
MDEMKYALLTEVLGRWKAEIVESFLQSEGIEVVLVQDSISLSACGNPFASVQVFVPKEDLVKAREFSTNWEDLLQNEDEEQESEDPEED